METTADIGGTDVAPRRATMRISILSSLVVVNLFACTDATPADELANESVEDGESAKADGVDAFEFFTVTPDRRACSFNARCGGFFVSRPNRSTTICGRGQQAKRCYVDSLDFGGSGLPTSVADGFKSGIRNGDTVLLRGSIAPAPDDRGASLHVTQVWTAGSQTGTLEGVFVLAKDNGIRCIKAPCPTITETRLNSTRSANLEEIDLAASGADQAAIERATNHLFDDGVILVGDRFNPPGSATKGRSANQFFTKAPVPLHTSTPAPLNVGAPTGPRDGFDIKSTSLAGDVLSVIVSFGGGCKAHDFKLFWDGTSLETNPPQVTLVLAHDGHGDTCEAFVTRTLTFDLAPLKAVDDHEVSVTLTGGVAPVGLEFTF